jgi:hypothetical protein
MLRERSVLGRRGSARRSARSRPAGSGDPPGCGACSGGELQVALQDWERGRRPRSLRGGWPCDPMAEHGLPAGRADVVELVDALAEHRHEITLVLVVGDDHWEGGQQPGAATSHFQRAQAAWRQPGRGGPPPQPVEHRRHAVRATALVHPPVELVRHRGASRLTAEATLQRSRHLIARDRRRVTSARPPVCRTTVEQEPFARP